MKKNNGVLFGALLIIIGVYILLSKYIRGFEFLPWLAIGLTLLLLYHCKHKTWALVLGLAITEISFYVAASGIGLRALKLPHVLFFFIPGSVFLALFVLRNKQELLAPGSFLLWFGLGLVLEALLPRRISVLTICAGLAFVSVYLLRSAKNSSGYLYVGMVVTFFGVLSSLGLKTSGGLSTIGWIALILLCAVQFIKKMRRKKTEFTAHAHDSDTSGENL